MAIYVNVGHVPSDGSKPWKHLHPRCPALQQRAERGFPVQRVRNIDAGKSLEQQSRRRCGCFHEQVKFVPRNDPRWLNEAASAQAKSPEVFWTYSLHDPATRDAQVGMAQDLRTRLRSRWRATCKAGLPPDGIPWLNARLAEDPSYEPVLDVEPYVTREAALQAEKALRQALRENGWHVSSDV